MLYPWVGEVYPMVYPWVGEGYPVVYARVGMVGIHPWVYARVYSPGYPRVYYRHPRSLTYSGEATAVRSDKALGSNL